MGPRKIDLSKPKPIHLSIENAQSREAWYVKPPSIVPHIQGDFIGSIAAGAAVNFNDIAFNPHAHGTHTECVGHILAGNHNILDLLETYHFEALLVSVRPEKIGADWVITKEILAAAISGQQLPPALIIRTLPNSREKLTKQYSHSNPPFLSEAAAESLRAHGVQHLLVDLPSVDKEEDQGALLAHKAFWNIGSTANLKNGVRKNATITEFVFVAASLPDGPYFLQFGLGPFVNDACPSTVFLYNFENA